MVIDWYMKEIIPIGVLCKYTKIKIIYHAIFKLMQTCCFGYFGHAFPHQSKTVVSTYQKLWYLTAYKKSTLFPTFSLRYCKLVWVSGHFGDDWQKSTRKIAWTWRKFLHLSACRNSTSHHSLLSWDIAKIVHDSCYFENFKHVWPC